MFSPILSVGRSKVKIFVSCEISFTASNLEWNDLIGRFLNNLRMKMIPSMTANAMTMQEITISLTVKFCSLWHCVERLSPKPISVSIVSARERQHYFRRLLNPWRLSMLIINILLNKFIPVFRYLQSAIV
jgi:hypothetical protein